MALNQRMKEAIELYLEVHKKQKRRLSREKFLGVHQVEVTTWSMPKLPLISGKNFVKLLEKYGFQIVRQKDSHVFMMSPDKWSSSVIPVHANEDLGKGLLKAILNNFQMSVEAFVKMK